MRRAVILTTPISRLLAVAGASAARDGSFDSGRPEGTVPETTMLERVSERPQEATTTAGHHPDEAGATRAENPDNDLKDDGGRADEIRTSNPEIERNARDEERGRKEPADEHEGGEEPGAEKVTVCHERKTISVGAPAGPAHLGHGDHYGSC